MPKGAKLVILFFSISLVTRGLWAIEGKSSAVGPKHVEQGRQYIFYMHGAWLETHGLRQSHPKHGRYQYEEIVGVLKNKGYQVMSEIRQERIHPLEYAGKIADQVNHLLETEVLPSHITVMGHSKGGHMALIVASLVQNPKVNYVVLAGCGKPGTAFRSGYDQFLAERAQYLRGRVLSMYDSADREAATCREAFGQNPDFETKEIILQTGRGHGLFYSPEPIWVEEAVKWIDQIKH